MSRLDDLFGDKKPKGGIPVNIEVTCEICFWPCDEVLYDKKTQTLTARCKNEHEMVSKIGLDFLIDGR